MHHIFAEAAAELARVLHECGLSEDSAILPLGVTVEPPADSAFGDVSTNAAMVLAKAHKTSPRALAEKIAEGLQGSALFETPSVAGPGFINARFSPHALLSALNAVLARGETLPEINIGQGEALNVEYVSANPTGPMHIGHARGAIYGDALASLAKAAGYKVTREYYINDAGAQIDVLATSVLHRYREALGLNPGPVPAGCYPGEYVKDVATALKERYADSLVSGGMDEAEVKRVVRATAVDMMMEAVRADLLSLGIRHDVFVSERRLLDEGSIDQALAVLDAAGHLYTGVPEAPKGKTPDDYEPRPQRLFRSTAWGDDQDRALVKSDGSHTYFAGDVAYHYDKIKRGFRRMVIVLGADHGGYVKRLSAAVQALSDGAAGLDAKIAQIVRYLRGGEPMKMSKRAGTFATVRDAVDEFGKDALRFMMLTRKIDAPFDFDADVVRAQSKDNPVFYVQYAHARGCSVLRRIRESSEFTAAVGDPALGLSPAEFARLNAPEELALLRAVIAWPRALEQAAKALEPHRIAFYAGDLASAFHSLWSKGNENAELRFLQPGDPEVTRARVALILSVLFTLRCALSLTGAEATEEM